MDLRTEGTIGIYWPREDGVGISQIEATICEVTCVERENGMTVKAIVLRENLTFFR
jgi:hypothetical protein